jgi:hypothetical protein
MAATSGGKGRKWKFIAIAFWCSSSYQRWVCGMGMGETALGLFEWGMCRSSRVTQPQGLGCAKASSG